MGKYGKAAHRRAALEGWRGARERGTRPAGPDENGCDALRAGEAASKRARREEEEFTATDAEARRVSLGNIAASVWERENKPKRAPNGKGMRHGAGAQAAANFVTFPLIGDLPGQLHR